ncbi:SRPBCC family protein [Streptomyces harbinensis]|uniref:SRPBCC family protein n=1 Tax=Streptomyces harbinensis TaxID=1176198 RepID=UPI0034DE197B
MESLHLSTRIERPADEVYAYAGDPAQLPAWAAGLGGSIELVDGRWVAASSPMGRVEVTFAPRNPYGVLDHEVRLPGGETVYNPLRVIPDGPDACEVVFTVRQRAGESEADFRRDAAAVEKDLATLKRLLERG